MLNRSVKQFDHQKSVEADGLRRPQAGIISTFPLDERNTRWLADHRVQDIGVIPGALYIDLAMSAAEAAGMPADIARDIRFEQVYILAESGDTGGVIRVECVDRDGEAFMACLSEASNGDWTRHASLRVVSRDRADDIKRPPHIKLDSESWRTCSKASLYRDLDRNGNQYRSSFQGIEAIAIDKRQCLAVAKLPPEIREDWDGQGLHPVMLDVCAQSLAAIQLDIDKTFILEGIDELLVHESPTDQFRVWARLGRDEGAPADACVGDVDIIDAAGASLLQLKGVRFRYLDIAKTDAKSKREAVETMAISATFTAEPLDDLLHFWADQLDIDIAPKYAPFNQIFQELLDPQSLLSNNDAGLNVTALRLEDWAQGVANDEGAEEQRTVPAVSGPSETYTLPNQLTIAHINQYETEYLFKEIFVDRCYVRHGISLEDAACVIDIGANIGMFTMFVQQQSPNARVFSFEPGPQVFQALEANSRLLSDHAKVFNSGVSDKAGEATFTYYDKSTVFSTFSADEADDQAAIRAVIENMVHDDTEETVETESAAEVDGIVDELLGQRLESRTMTCPLVTISGIMRENGIEQVDLLKVDAEKSELAILNGIDDADWPKIKQIVIEVHDKVGDLIETVVKLLRDRGFTFEMTEEDLLRNSGLYNIYATRETEAKAPSSGMRLSSRDRALIEQTADEFVQAASSFAARSKLPHIVAFCSASTRLAEHRPDADYLRAIEADLTARLAGLGGVHILTSRMIEARYPVADYFDAVGDQAGRVPYTPAYYCALATAMFRQYHVTKRQPYKVIVLDCDNTLWKGVCGEEGPDGIELDAPSLALQSFVKRKIDQGMIVCLCSKNVEDDVHAVFKAHPEMPLQMDDIVAARINWQPKSANLISLAEELNLGLDSFIMIDDSPVECAEIQAGCPSVLTLQLPVDQPKTIARFLDHVWAFDLTTVTSEGRKRTQLYKQNVERENLRSESMTLSDFLSKLNLDIRIEAMKPDNLERVADLTRRTNQFNFSTIRRSVGEIRALTENGTLECAVVTVKDRFGDYGLVGAVMVESGDGTLTIDTMLLSCRVLGRGVEHEMLGWVGKLARKKLLARVDIPYHPTAKSVPAGQFLDAVGSAYRTPADGDKMVYRWPSAELAALKFEPELAVAETAVPNTRQVSEDVPAIDRASARLHDISERIAGELHDPERILELSRESGGPQERPDLATLYLAPKTELELGVADVWAKVLGLNKVGIRDNFFDLGGTSLKAVQLIAELKRQVDLQIGIVNLFAEPTIEALVRHADDAATDIEATEKATESQLRGAARRTAPRRRRAR